MRSIIVSSLLIGLGSSALAADEKPVGRTFTVNEIVAISGAVQRFNPTCQNRVIKDGPKESFVCDPLPVDKQKPGIVWQLAEVQSKTAQVLMQFQLSHNRIVATLPRKADGNLTE